MKSELIALFMVQLKAVIKSSINGKKPTWPVSVGKSAGRIECDIGVIHQRVGDYGKPYNVTKAVAVYGVEKDSPGFVQIGCWSPVRRPHTVRCGLLAYRSRQVSGSSADPVIAGHSTAGSGLGLGDRACQDIGQASPGENLLPPPREKMSSILVAQQVKDCVAQPVIAYRRYRFADIKVDFGVRPTLADYGLSVGKADTIHGRSRRSK